MKAATQPLNAPTCSSKFQSTPPVKAATEALDMAITLLEISIHAAREGGDAFFVQREGAGAISIHAAHEGGDDIAFYVGKTVGNFNPRRP